MLAILIINYKNYQQTIECISSIKETTHNLKYHIYVLDNASPNESYRLLKKKYENDSLVSIINSDINLGYAKGNNLLAIKAIDQKSNYLLFSNSDILYKKDSIKNLLESLKNDPLDFVAPKVFLPSGKIQKSFKLELDQPNFNFLLNYSYFSSFLFFKHRKKNKSPEINNLTKVKWVSGCSFMAKTSSFAKIGMFDTHTFLYYEESCLAKKILKHKMLIAYQPNAHVIHFHQGSVGSFNVNVSLAGFDSCCYYFKQYTKPTRIFFFLLWMAHFSNILWQYKKKKSFSLYRNYFKKSILVLRKYW